MTLFSFEDRGTKDRANFRKPPRWAESLLIGLLKPRDRETIPGDLLEEYREERLPLMGRVRANLWYLRQVAGVACFQPFQGGPMKRVLLCSCFFTLAATAWLGIMEIILRHPGFGLRSCLASLFACQSLTTIFFLIFRGWGRLRLLLMLAGGLTASVGISTVVSILKAAHFEGYVLLIGSALVVQGTLTIAALQSKRFRENHLGPE
jgi:hypothetical protein